MGISPFASRIDHDEQYLKYSRHSTNECNSSVISASSYHFDRRNCLDFYIGSKVTNANSTKSAIVLGACRKENETVDAGDLKEPDS